MITFDDPNLNPEFSTTGLPATDLIDTTQAVTYMDDVRVYLPAGMEDQFFWGGVSDIVAGYVAYAFMTDIDPKECAETILKKLGANNE